MHERGLRCDMSAAEYYMAMFHIKDAIEYVAREGKDPNDIDEIIKALETVPCSTPTILPKEKAVFGLKERGLFHSYPAAIGASFQIQGRDKWVVVTDPDNPYVTAMWPKELLEPYCHPELAKWPAELRAMYKG